MLCCTSAPPTTLICVLPEITGHVVGARKQTCGLRAGSLRGLGGRLVANVLVVDTFETFGGFLDAGVVADPALLLRGDLVAVEVCVDDGRGDLRGRALADHLL